jgi:hypothetical protein
MVGVDLLVRELARFGYVSVSGWSVWIVAIGRAKKGGPVRARSLGLGVRGGRARGRGVVAETDRLGGIGGGVAERGLCRYGCRMGEVGS